MINPNLIFKIVFHYSNRQMIKNLTQVPSMGDKVRFNNNIFEVVNICWDLNSYVPEDTGYQAVVGIQLKQVGVTP